MAKKMTKSQLLEVLAEKTGNTKKDVATFLETIAETAYKYTKENGEFTLPGIGKLVKKHRAARMGRNPATGEQIQIGAKTVVKFRVAKAAKDSIL
ncbi:MAG: HU family DNA-binding protein [bacterium]|nr:HU family DNA-binding protein [bacterium]